MYKKNEFDNIKGLGCVFNAFLFVLLMFSSCDAKNRQNVEWVETIGYIEGNSSNCYIHYEVNGKSYKVRYAKKYGSLDENEKSYLRYNKTNPNEVEILYWKPTFLKEEQTIFVKGYIKRVFWFHWLEPKYAIAFIYSIGGVEVKREQILPPNYKAIYPNLMKGQWYEVECWAENPQRAIIHLDKPVKASDHESEN